MWERILGAGICKKTVIIFLLFVFQSLIYSKNCDSLAVSTVISSQENQNKTIIPLSSNAFLIINNPSQYFYIDESSNIFEFNIDENGIWKIHTTITDASIYQRVFRNFKLYILKIRKFCIDNSIIGLRGILIKSFGALLLEPSSITNFLDRGLHLSIFNKKERRHTSVYHRSAKNPAIIGQGIGKEVASEVVTNSSNIGNTGKGREAHLGLYPNIATHQVNNLGRDRHLEQQRNPLSGRINTEHGDGLLYDLGLKYRLMLCMRLKEKFDMLEIEETQLGERRVIKQDVNDLITTLKEARGRNRAIYKQKLITLGRGVILHIDQYISSLRSSQRRLKYVNILSQVKKEINSEISRRYITVNVANDYPNVMVHIDLRQFLIDYCCKRNINVLHSSIGTTKSFTIFLMSYYTGLVNYIAQVNGFKVTLTERSSFGFFSPTIAETEEAFRINLGMVHPDYINVHVRALEILETSLRNLVDSGCVRNADRYAALNRNSYFQDKNLANIRDWVEFAFSKIEKKNRTAITNAMRTRDVIDFVNVTAFNELGTFPNNLLQIIFSRVFSNMNVRRGSLSTEVPAESLLEYREFESGFRPLDINSEDHELFVNLKDFIDIMKLRISLEMRSESRVDLKNYMSVVLNLLKPDNLYLHTVFDTINELLLSHGISILIDNTNTDELRDGYGSDEETEDGLDEDNRIYSKKVIVHNGMRALLTSIEAASSIYDEELKVFATHDAYYELHTALIAVNKTRLNISVQAKNDATPCDIIMLDANAILNTRDMPDENIEVTQIAEDKQAKIWIIDTTSTIQEKMNEIYRAFKQSSNAQILFFVSSGFKNEQAGADRNQYGTIFVFVKTDKNRLNEIMRKIKGTEQPLVASSHILRRMFKRLGFVPSSNYIINPFKNVFENVKIYNAA